MELLNKTKIYWSIQIGGWSLFATINMTLAYFQGNFNFYSFVYAFLLAVWFVISTHTYRIFLNRWGWLEKKIKEVIWRILLSIFIITITNFFIHIGILASLGVLVVEYDLDPAQVGVYLLSTFFIYFFWTLFYIIFHYFERYNTALKYEALKNEIELNNLKTQLNPHFIFNALNSIRALVDENPLKSKDAITQLSNILRSSLVSNSNKLISFQDELNTVKDYLNLEFIRFEERLKTNFDIDPKSNTFYVPPMMIQTLVENGIKHGISKLKEGGEISLTTRVHNSTLSIVIANSGKLEKSQIKGTKGYGIENTIRRLNLLYGKEASFTIRDSEKANVVIAEVILPQKI